MKNLFKYAMMFVAILTSVVCFTACSSDDDDSANFDSEKCLGYWICTSSTEKVGDKTYEDSTKGRTVSIKNNGTYTSDSYYIGDGTYVFSGNVAKINTNNGWGSYTVKVSFSGEKMVWDGSGVAGKNNCEFHYVFEKK